MSTGVANMSCIGEPVSWMRLEQYVLARSDARVTEHVAACPACRACLEELERDVVALPPLALPQNAAASARRRWWTFALPTGLALAAAALLLLVLRPRDGAQSPDDHDEPRGTNVTSVKGVGTIELGVVRDRAGVITEDVLSFTRGDRWKLVVTCAADRSAWIDVAIVEVGAREADYPLAPARVVCGNRIALSGAFSLTTAKPHVVCVRVSTNAAPARSVPTPGAPGVACVTLQPE